MKVVQNIVTNACGSQITLSPIGWQSLQNNLSKHPVVT